VGEGQAEGSFQGVTLFRNYFLGRLPGGLRGRGPLKAVPLVALAWGAIAGIWTLAVILGPAVYRYKQRRSAAPDVYISPRAIFHNGSYTNWDSRLLRLRVMLAKGDPDVLCFEITDNGLDGRPTRMVRVAVPPGCEQEAADLLSRLD
jgi:hypothetical protein